jgi:predicted oxidoreductase
MNMHTTLPAPPPIRALYPGGKTVSGLAWGMWRFKGGMKPARVLIDTAFQSGICFFDTADIYGADGDGFGSAETLLGRVFADDRSLRDHMVLATKGGIALGVPYDQSKAYLETAINASLTRLGVDHVDLWQIHRPDILTHPHEMARVLEDAHRAGKIGAIGVSNFSVAQTAAFAHYLTVPLATTQPEFSPLHLDPIENGLLDHAMTHRTGVMAWSPLGGGRIACPTNDRERAVSAALDIVASAQNLSRTAVACSWIMAHPAGIIPIIGSQQAARIVEAADAYKVRWTRPDWYRVLIASRGAPLP